MSGNNKERMTRTVTEKIINAENNHLGDQFEVANWFREGRFSLDVDVKKADAYTTNVVNKLPKERPYFSSVDLVNFKGIRGVRGKIELDPYLNVFVGVNGSGKTTILDAFARISSWIVNGIRSYRTNGRHIDSSEINRHYRAKSSAIIASLSLGNSTGFNIELCKNRSSTSKVRSSLAEFKNLAEMYYYYFNSQGEENATLPLFSYYSVSRALEVKNEDGKKDEELTTFNVLDGYNELFEDSRSFKQLLKWMVFISAQNTNQIDTIDSEYHSIKAVNDSIKDIYNNLPDVIAEKTNFGKELLSKIAANNVIIADMENKMASNDSNAIKVVRDAIYRFMAIKNIRMQVTNDSVSILMDKNGVTISATDLSQGEKAIFSLVSDISRRLVLLNPGNSQNALSGFGVVMIDEIDLHLHPKWQQEIVSKLREVFPNIQFILTTHSPQVLSTIPNSCIKIINNDESGNVSVIEPDFSLGSESSMILEDIFLVDQRPKNVEIVKILDKYKILVSQDKWDTPEAMDLFKKLEDWGTGRDPVINQLKMDVRLRKHRRGKID